MRNFLTDSVGSWAGLPQILEDKILPEPNSGCWIWMGSIYGTGYGCITANKKYFLVHRVVYKCLRGTIPSNLQIDHLCRNRICCNPDHLEPVTSKVNALRGNSILAKNARKIFCKYGHKLTEENTYEYRRNKGSRACIICNKLGNAYRYRQRACKND
jgi:hypothetical protein